MKSELTSQNSKELHLLLSEYGIKYLSAIDKELSSVTQHFTDETDFTGRRGGALTLYINILHGSHIIGCGHSLY